MSELQRCRNILTDLHNRISELERGQVSAASNAGMRAATLASAASVAISNQPSVSQPATTAVSSRPSSSNPAAATAGPSLCSTRTQAELEHQRVFGYMPRSDTQGASSRRKANGRGQQPPAKKRKYKPTWTRIFVCLASTSDSRMPSPTYYRELKRASLGEKSITLNIADNSVEFDFKLKMEFPKLDMAGGYVLMCSHNSSRTLEEIKPPYNVQRLKRETGQCKIFIRPLQSDLDLTPDACEEEKEEEDTVEQCFVCRNFFYLAELPCHLNECNTSETAPIQAVNQLPTGESQEEFQAGSVTAEHIIPPTEHVGPSAGANPSPALVNTLASGSPLVVIDDASSGVIPPDAIAYASSGVNPSAATANTLASGSPPDAIADASSGANPSAGTADAIANASSGAHVNTPVAIADASTGANSSAALVNTLARGSPPVAIVDASSDVTPPDAIADVSSGVIPPAGGNPPVKKGSPGSWRSKERVLPTNSARSEGKIL